MSEEQKTTKNIKDILDDNKNLNNEQKLILKLSSNLGDLGYKLNNKENVLTLLSTTKKPELEFDKSGQILHMKFEQINGKYEISLSMNDRNSSEQLKTDYFKDDNVIKDYICERIGDLEKNYKNVNFIKDNNSFMSSGAGKVQMDREGFCNRNNGGFNPFSSTIPDTIKRAPISPLPFQDNVYPSTSSNMPNFNLGYRDLHGDLPYFPSPFGSNNRGNLGYGNMNFMGGNMGIDGNLMGPEAFNRLSKPGSIRYDPITPFGPGFDFIPQTGNGGFGGGMNPFI